MEGIRIENAALEVDDAGLDALLKNEGAAVRITAGQVRVSNEALARLLQRAAPEAEASVSARGVEATLPRDGGALRVSLAAAGLRIDFRDDGVVLSLAPAEASAS